MRALVLMEDPWIERGLDDAFWSRISIETSEEGVEHWVPAAGFSILDGAALHRHAWRDLQAEMDLEQLGHGQWLSRTCSVPRCVHPEHHQRARDARLDLRTVAEQLGDDAFWSRLEVECDDYGFEHWVVGPRSKRLHHGVWERLEEHLDLAHLRPGAPMQRLCDEERCAHPLHWTPGRGGAGRGRRARRDAVRAEREEKARRYREDPVYREQVRAELAARSRRYREYGRAQASRRRQERTNGTDERKSA